MSGILEVLGGIGLFLLGMHVMSDGLNRLAGETLRRILHRFTRTPWTGMLTGMIVTMLIQSSGATTVMALGFVGAGLMTFPQALGIIFGANIGTTFTGWMVALLGFTLNLKTAAMPLLFLGALLRLTNRPVATALGFAVAGFGAIFVGIAMLQTGMEGYRDYLNPSQFPPDTWIGRLLMLMLGLAITLVTQSSSAGVAAAITALHVGTISLPQAAAMVIGMDIGTTNVALLASLGGNVHVRRTGLSHVVYNVLTGTAAFLVLPGFLNGVERGWPGAGDTHPEVVLVAFHSLFNILGVLLILPFTGAFARLMERLVPSRRNALTEQLEPTFLRQPQVALDSVRSALRQTTQQTCGAIAELLSHNSDEERAWNQLAEAEQAIAEIRRYLSEINDPVAAQRGFRRKVQAVHLLDHLQRLIVRMHRPGRLESVRQEIAIREHLGRLKGLLEQVALLPAEHERAYRELQQLARDLSEQVEQVRHAAIEQAVTSPSDLNELSVRLDALRWLERITMHCERIAHYLSPDASIEPETDKELKTHGNAPTSLPNP